MGGLSCCPAGTGALPAGGRGVLLFCPGICTSALSRRAGAMEAARLGNVFTLFPPSCFEAVSHHGNAGRAGKSWRGEGSGESLEPFQAPGLHPGGQNFAMKQSGTSVLSNHACSSCSCRYRCVWRELLAKVQKGFLCCTTAS